MERGFREGSGNRGEGALKEVMGIIERGGGQKEGFWVAAGRKKGFQKRQQSGVRGPQGRWLQYWPQCSEP